MMTQNSHHGNSNCRSARQSRPKISRHSGTSRCRCQGKTIVASPCRINIAKDVIAGFHTRPILSSHYITFSVSKHGRFENVTSKTRHIFFQSIRISSFMAKSG